MAVNVSSCHLTVREEANRKYRTKRLQEGYVFLKTITFDGDYDAGDDDVFLDDSLNEETRFSLENDQSFCNLENARVASQIHRGSLSASNFASLIEDDTRHQKKQFDHDHACRSRSTFINLKELAKQLIHVASSPTSLKQNSKDLSGKRVVLVTRNHVPFQIFSVIPHKKAQVTTDSSRRTSLTTANQHSAIYIDDIDLGDVKREVSYKHLLNPVVYTRKRIRSESEVEPLLLSNDSENCSIDEVEQVLLDDPQLTCGKHRTVLNLPSYTVSILQYAKPSKVKKDINMRFKEKFPSVTITLTKLRSIKAEMMAIGQKLSLDLAIIACSFVYFEKAVLKTRITKHNRKYIAGACLLLSIKFFDDFESKNIKACIEAITDQFRLSPKDLHCCELQVLIMMEFSLMTPIGDVMQVYKRLEAAAL